MYFDILATCKKLIVPYLHFVPDDWSFCKKNQKVPYDGDQTAIPSGENRRFEPVPLNNYLPDFPIVLTIQQGKLQDFEIVAEDRKFFCKCFFDTM